MDGCVDIGADEYGECEVDFDFDGVVNFYDYVLFAAKWQTTISDPNYEAIYDLNADDIVDFDDLDIFVQHWLWIGGWTEIEGLMTMMMEESIGIEKFAALESVSQQAEVIEEPVDVEELLKWLEELWLDGELKEVMTEEEFYEFMKLLYSAQE